MKMLFNILCNFTMLFAESDAFAPNGTSQPQITALAIMPTQPTPALALQCFLQQHFWGWWLPHWPCQQPVAAKLVTPLSWVEVVTSPCLDLVVAAQCMQLSAVGSGTQGFDINTVDVGGFGHVFIQPELIK